MGWIRHMEMARNIVEEFARQFVIYPEEDMTLSRVDTQPIFTETDAFSQ